MAKETTNRMNDDGIYPPFEKSATHGNVYYQENNATTEGYKSKQIHESLYNKANLKEVTKRCMYLSNKRQQ